MKDTLAAKHFSRPILIIVAVMALAAFSVARSLSGSITVVNNSSRTISHVYFSHASGDDWTSDQLNDAAVYSNSSAAVSTSSWDASQLKVIAEDQDGCFASIVINRDGSSTWTITNDTARDCGY